MHRAHRSFLLVSLLIGTWSFSSFAEPAAGAPQLPPPPAPPAGATPVSPAPSATPAAPVEPAKLGGRLVFEPSNSDAVIERREYYRSGVGHDSQWVTVCSAPCNVRLDSEVDYRVGGSGIEPSRSFRVAPNGTTMVRSDVASTGSKWGGIIALGVGIVAVNVGPVFIAAGAIENLDAKGDHSGSNNVRLGTVITLAGVAAGITGLVLFLSNDKTTTQLSWSPQSASSRRPPPKLGFTF
jgi:hypothetical protein